MGRLPMEPFLFYICKPLYAKAKNNKKEKRKKEKSYNISIRVFYNEGFKGKIIK